MRRAAASRLEAGGKEEPLIRCTKCKGHIKKQTIKSQGTTCTDNRKCVQMYEKFGKHAVREQRTAQSRQGKCGNADPDTLSESTVCVATEIQNKHKC